MAARQQVLDHLKRTGSASIADLMRLTGLAETAIRHHLRNLEDAGFVRPAEERHRKGPGRPTQLYELTEAAEGLFPKRYPELLNLVLAALDDRTLLGTVFDDIAIKLATQMRPSLEGLSGKARLEAAAQHLNLLGPLSEIEDTPAGWEVHAYNCPYLAAGRSFEAVCELAPRVITQATGMPAERPACQRDGQRACHLVVQRAPIE
jgi:predicted ArsR family transcriptional regulator